MGCARSRCLSTLTVWNVLKYILSPAKVDPEKKSREIKYNYNYPSSIEAMHLIICRGLRFRSFMAKWYVTNCGKGSWHHPWAMRSEVFRSQTNNIVSYRKAHNYFVCNLLFLPRCHFRGIDVGNLTEVFRIDWLCLQLVHGWPKVTEGKG